MTKRNASRKTATKGGTMTAIAEIEPLWSVQDVSTYLGIPVHTIYAWRGAGTGPPGRRIGKRLRYRPEDVRAWVAALPTEVVA